MGVLRAISSPNHPKQNQLIARLDDVRRVWRARRRRVQLSLATAVLLVAGGGAGATVALGGSGPSMLFYSLPVAWLTLLGVMPLDVRAICGALLLTAVFSIALAALAFDYTWTLPGGRSAVGYYALVVHAANIAACGRAAHALVRHRAARAALEILWRSVGATMLAAAPAWIALGVIELEAQIVRQGRERQQLSARSIAAVRFTLAGEMLALGALSLWPRLRESVQARLASLGEGVSAAAGIAAAVSASDRPEAILARARNTFRSVRLDALELRHLDSNAPADAAYAISNAAQLGSVDAFISHSWQDSADEKWRLLQEWRAAFSKRHGGREPTVWFDRCCICPSELGSLLPCLPVYLAGCDRLLPLRGPTYLNRLWCVVELYCFFEMKSNASRIQILDFEGMPPYTDRGHLGDATRPHDMPLSCGPPTAAGARDSSAAVSPPLGASCAGTAEQTPRAASASARSPLAPSQRPAQAEPPPVAAPSALAQPGEPRPTRVSDLSDDASRHARFSILGGAWESGLGSGVRRVRQTLIGSGAGDERDGALQIRRPRFTMRRPSLLVAPDGASTDLDAAGHAAAASRPRLGRFDVQLARCTTREDEEALFAAIEGFGAGYAAFNDWVHTLLSSRWAATRRDQPVDSAAGETAAATPARPDARHASVVWGRLSGPTWWPSPRPRYRAAAILPDFVSSNTSRGCACASGESG